MTLLPSLVAIASMVCALIPARMVRSNLRVFRSPGPATDRVSPPAVSVLIPARDEEDAIGASVSAALASRGVELEVVVLDDRSRDATAEVVQALSRRDPRVRLVPGRELPPGWCGKQHACWLLAQEARHPLLVFVDADVRLSPDALARMVEFLEDSGADLASGFPHQETVGLLERLIIPLIHFILLGFLPIARMRRSRDPAFAAGCGQLVITRRDAYERSGGHAAIRQTLHDGVKLPRAYRRAGLPTDIFDATELASCRMYRSAAAVWSGLAKNAGEGLAAPRLIGPMTAVLVTGQVLPPLLIACLAREWASLAMACALGALFASYDSRWAMTRRFRQSRLGALLHPIGVLVLLLIQWYSFARNLAGRPSSWKGRSYPARPTAVPSHRESPMP